MREDDYISMKQALEKALEDINSAGRIFRLRDWWHKDDMRIRDILKNRAEQIRELQRTVRNHEWKDNQDGEV